MKNKTKISISFWGRAQLLAIRPRELILFLATITYRVFYWSFSLLSPKYMEWTSRRRFKRVFFHAVRNVPAYSDFVSASGGAPERIPETDKKSYILAYPVEKRCVGGRLPTRKMMIDESSGSTGTPYNWVRKVEERSESHKFISYFSRYCFGKGPWLTINAFSMGAWATGFNMGLALQINSVVKNTGPDIIKIFKTLEYFGPGHEYLILGYPPFIKQIIDAAEIEGFPLEKYTLNAMVGGEGMSEGLRDYILRRFRKVYSGYGATDLEIGIAGETPLSVAIRRLARENEAIRKKLFGNDSRLPMLFQYNPVMHYVEVNENKELVFTITRLSLLSPRIRYNIHDEGGVARYDQVEDILGAEGHGIKDFPKGQERKHLRLPFLWVYGRRDFTISIMGANIYPEDIESAIYSEKKLARVTRSFCQSVQETPDGKVKPCFSFEIEAPIDEGLKALFSEVVLNHLIKINADFREAYHEYPETLIPEIKLYNINEGPFKMSPGQIKQKRFLGKQQ
jgi:phenylacetate-CoA ligase